MQKHGLIVSMCKKQLRKEFVNFLKNLSISHEEEYAGLLFKVSSRESYVETLSNKADSLHYHLDKTYPEVIEEEFYWQARKLIRRQRLGSGDIIVDITTEKFYGESTSLCIHPWTGEQGIKGKFHYLVAGILFRNKILPFYVAILPRGAFKADFLGNIVKLCNKIHLQVRCMYLDRGFYSGEVIDELELRDINYLIFARKSSLFKYMLESVDKAIIVKHEIRYTKNRSSHIAETNIALIKDVDGYDWCFATNHILENIEKYVQFYRRRWNIETMFRVHDEAKIKSKSIKSIIRLFYFIISMLIVLLWNLYAKQDYTFKRFLVILENDVENFGTWETR